MTNDTDVEQFSVFFLSSDGKQDLCEQQQVNLGFFFFLWHCSSLVDKTHCCDIAHVNQGETSEAKTKFLRSPVPRVTNSGCLQKQASP